MADITIVEVECVECEERVGYMIVGDRLGQVPDPDRAPMVLCPDCGDRIEAFREPRVESDAP